MIFPWKHPNNIVTVLIYFCNFVRHKLQIVNKDFQKYNQNKDF